MPKSGEFHKVFVAIDPTVRRPATTELHAVLYAYKKAKLDSDLTKEGWKRNNGFYYAPEGVHLDLKYIVPAYDARMVKQIQKEGGTIPGLLLINPSDVSQNFLFCGTSERVARERAKYFCSWARLLFK